MELSSAGNGLHFSSSYPVDVARALYNPALAAARLAAAHDFDIKERQYSLDQEARRPDLAILAGSDPRSYRVYDTAAGRRMKSVDLPPQPSGIEFAVKLSEMGVAQRMLSRFLHSESAAEEALAAPGLEVGVAWAGGSSCVVFRDPDPADRRLYPHREPHSPGPKIIFWWGDTSRMARQIEIPGQVCFVNPDEAAVIAEMADRNPTMTWASA